jgi:serine/threonine-protein kinase
MVPVSKDAKNSFDALLREAAELRVPAVDRSSLPRIGELVDGKYRVEQKLGEGGMGAVFRATNIESGKQVALKWLLACSAGASARFRREGHIASQIDHPNVVNVYDIGSHRGGRYLVMELLRGESLGARLCRGHLEPSEMVEIMIPVLRGVAAAHEAGVIHRDLKPDNVFLCAGADGTPRGPKVLDFGISKLRSDSAAQDRLTAEGTCLGTLAYMSPEQLVDAPSVDERTDIYAAGVMMYEALTSRLPFHAQGHNALVLAIAEQQPRPVRQLKPGLASALEGVVMRAMAKNVADRHVSVKDLIDDLQSCMHTRGGATQRDVGAGRRPAAGSAARRSRLRAALAAACMLVASWFAGRSTTSPVQAASGSGVASAAPLREIVAARVHESENAISVDRAAAAHVVMFERDGSEAQLSRALVEAAASDAPAPQPTASATPALVKGNRAGVILPSQF